MKQLEFFSKNNVATVLALGYFDCVHIGHRRLFEHARSCAQALGVSFAAITFDNDPFEAIHVNARPIYNYERRCRIMEQCGVDLVVRAHFDEKFRAMSPLDFLDTLIACASPICVVCGADYRFGKNAEGNVSLLQDYCSGRGISVQVIDFVQRNGEKVSSRDIRKLLQQGRIEEANALLGQPYHLTAKVRHGRGEGRSYACPTANIPMTADCGNLMQGVYGTRIFVDGACYYGVTNVGSKPTFGDSELTIETNVIDFNGDLYGKTVTVELIRRLRDVRCFESKAELYEQIEIDKRWYL